MHRGESFNSGNKASKEGSLFGWCKQDRCRSPCLGSGPTFFHFMWLQLSSNNHHIFITYCDCRLLIFLHLLTMTTWKNFMQLWTVFFLLIFELERSALHQLNSMLDFLPKVRFTITRYTMMPSWIHSNGTLLTIVCINSIALLWEKLQHILLASMISLPLPMHPTMIGYQIQWSMYSDSIWKKWYVTSSKSSFFHYHHHKYCALYLPYLYLLSLFSVKTSKLKRLITSIFLLRELFCK